MTAMRNLSFCLVLLLAAGCGETSNGDPVEAGKGGWNIAAGVYGNVVRDGESGDPAGIELSLDRGSESETVDFVRCDAGCSHVEKRPLRRGMNGISFTIQGAGQPVDVMVTPGGGNAVELSVDRGNGLETHRLPRIEQAFGLALARNKADGTAVPSADTP